MNKFIFLFLINSSFGINNNIRQENTIFNRTVSYIKTNYKTSLAIAMGIIAIMLPIYDDDLQTNKPENTSDTTEYLPIQPERNTISVEKISFPLFEKNTEAETAYQQNKPKVASKVNIVRKYTKDEIAINEMEAKKELFEFFEALESIKNPSIINVAIVKETLLSAPIINDFASNLHKIKHQGINQEYKIRYYSSNKPRNEICMPRFLHIRVANKYIQIFKLEDIIFDWIVKLIYVAGKHNPEILTSPLDELKEVLLPKFISETQLNQAIIEGKAKQVLCQFKHLASDIQ